MNTMNILEGSIQTIVAFFATIGFSVIFHAPRRELLYTGLTGAVGWLVYLIATGAGCGVVSASFLATIALCWLSRIFSFRSTPQKSPRVTSETRRSPLNSQFEQEGLIYRFSSMYPRI